MLQSAGSATYSWEDIMMNENTLRWNGLSVAIGGTLWLLPWTGWLGDIDDAAAFLLALVGMALVAFGIFGLYRRMSAEAPSRKITLVFGITLTGLLLIMASAVVGLFSGVSPSDPGEMPFLAASLALGMVILTAGLIGIGLVTLSERALGGLSFAPLLLALTMVGYVASIALAIADPTGDPLAFFDVATIGGWLLFGLALWAAKDRLADSTLPA
jgi:hypothetical protein